MIQPEGMLNVLQKVLQKLFLVKSCLFLVPFSFPLAFWWQQLTELVEIKAGAAAGGGGGDRAAAAPGLGEGQSGDVRWVTAEPAAGGEGLRQPGHPAVP